MFGPESEWPRQDLIAFSEEFDASLALAAYQSGVFPMPLLDGDHATDMGWWSPMARGVLPLQHLRVTRSLRKTARRYTTTLDLAFDEVMARCAEPGRPGGWITDEIMDVCRQFRQHDLAHSVEVWDQDGRLVGGLYGVSIGGLFCGESMFHDRQHGRDASKVALTRLVGEMADHASPQWQSAHRLLDVQWLTPHLESLGAIEIARRDYLDRLDTLLRTPPPRFKVGESGRHRGLGAPPPHQEGADHAGDA